MKKVLMVAVTVEGMLTLVALASMVYYADQIDAIAMLN